MQHMKFLETVSKDDIETLKEKEKTYKGSWKKRGGVGAFMMLARKWDRLENMMGDNGYDIFKLIESQRHRGDEDGTVLAEVRDLRRYLLLIEAEMFARSPFVQEELNIPGTPEDGGHHSRFVNPDDVEEE